MKLLTVLFLTLGLLLASAASSGNARRTFTGYVTDSMCGAGHVSTDKPDPAGVRACVRSNPAKWKYALAAGNDVYLLSDQKAGEKYAAAKVTVTGTLDEKAKTIQVESIAPAK